MAAPAMVQACNAVVVQHMGSMRLVCGFFV